jgi:class 3 adenylate cyclase
MFIEICDSTALVSTIGDQAWRDLLEWHDRLIEDIVGQHRGEILDRAGDSVFAAFDNPATRWAAPSRCNNAWRITASSMGSPSWSELAFIPIKRFPPEARTPAAASISARVAALAGPGEILVTLSTASAADASLQQRRPAVLKGIPDPR